MKKSISLIEVLISVILIAIVIVMIIQMKGNNLFLLEKFKDSTLNNGYILFAVNNNEKRNYKMYLSNIVNFEDDEIREELKGIKITVKNKKLKDLTMLRNDYIKSIVFVESTYVLNLNNKTTSRKFYTFKLE